MQRILASIGTGRLIGMALITATIIGAMIAVPLLVSADEQPLKSEQTRDVTIVQQGLNDLRIDRFFERASETRGSMTLEFGVGSRHTDPFATDVLDTVAELTGTDVEDVADALAEGQTLAEYAQEHGLNEDALVEAFMGIMDEKLDEAVEKDDLTAEQAERFRTESEEHLRALINGAWPMGEFGFGEVPSIDGIGGFPFERGINFELESNPVDITTELTDSDTEEVLEALADGQTLAEYAVERGATEDELVAAILEPIQEQLDNAVADDELTQAKADEIHASFEEHIRQMVNGEGFGFGFGHEFRPGGRFVPFGGEFGFPGGCDDSDGDSEETSNQI